MSMIKCPVCDKKISDKAVSCPVCGYVIPKSQNNFCGECGASLPAGATVCHNCGCPVEAASANGKQSQQLEVTINKSSKSKKGIVACIVLVLVIAGGWLLFSQLQAYLYNDTLRETISLIAAGSVEAEEAGGLIHDVWYNTIFNESDSETDKYTKNAFGDFNDDFNDSLETLYADPEFTEKIESIESNQDDVVSNMKELTNPPDKYKEAYASLKTLYSDYMEFSNLVLEPSGKNIFTYTESFNNCEEKLGKDLEAVRLYF